MYPRDPANRRERVREAAAQGWIDRRSAVLESVLGIRRAGADAVLTYWATELAGWLRGAM